MTTTARNRFKAHCRVGHAPETLTFEDGALFEAHMLEAHGAKPGHCAKRKENKDRNGRTISWGPVLGWVPFTIRRPIRASWKGPRLTEGGKAFEPTGLDVGATVTWQQYVSHNAEQIGWVERSGQVWSLGDMPKSVWVVPFEPREGESAVLLRERGAGRLEVDRIFPAHRRAA